MATIAVGGVAGASLRWALAPAKEPLDGGWFEYAPNSTATFAHELTFPTETLLVNVLGCLLLGALTLLLTRSLPVSRRILVGAATGFCGSLTTFSTFAVQIAERLRGLAATVPPSSVDPLSYGSEAGSALIYLITSVAAGALAFWLGRSLTQRIVTSPGDVTIGEDS